MKDDNNSIKDNLDDLFQDLVPDKDAPEAIKQEVFQTLDTLNLIGDIADLFTAKYSETEAAFFGLLGDSATDASEGDTDEASAEEDILEDK